MSRKTKKRKPQPSTVSSWWGRQSDQRRRQIGRSGGWIAVAVVGALVTVFGMKALERRVLRTPAGAAPRPVQFRLTNRPDWMPARLATRIVDAIAPATADFNDPKLTATVYDQASANPWIHEITRVSKKRGDSRSVGVIEIDATYRRAVARIQVAGGYAYVDAEGYRLPAAEVPQWVAAAPVAAGEAPRQVSYLHPGDAPPGLTPRQIHYILIDGVQAPASPVGQAWAGSDLQAGLNLVSLVASRKYASQVTVVDVRNCDGRINRDEPHLRMSAQYGRGRPTDIRFGRFPAPDGGDYVVSPERKLRYLDDYVADHDGWLAGRNSYIDLRFDQLHVSMN
jgi:hypothetical protein